MAISFIMLGQFCLLTSLSFFKPVTAILIPEADSNTYFPSYDYGFDTEALDRRQNNVIYPVTGVTGGAATGGGFPQRIEVRQLQKNTDLWTLYLLGLDMMQSTSQASPTSWYQISGIHGRPYMAWDSVQAASGMQNNGYCSHTSILFPTWHRPYLALYEQVLYGLVQRIATYYPAGAIRDRYSAAAKNFRIPYWDWAVVPPPGESVLPLSIGSAAVAVNGPSGTQTIANPLYSYVFKPLNTADLPDAPFRTWNRTLRYPTSTSLASAVSRNNLVAAQLDNNALSFRNRLYNLLVNYYDYTSFSNEAWIPENNVNNFDSIESIHDAIHGLTGSGGHMTYIDYSAFDPIFWLHHAMVDRTFAIWQVLNPDSYVVPELSKYSTYVSPGGSLQDINTALAPFHNSTTGSFWTSQNARYPENFGYSYPETSNPGSLTAAQMSTQVKAAINTLYGVTAPANTSPKTSKRGNDRKSDSLGPAKGSEYREWIANIVVKKHTLSVPFFIHIFIGSFSPDPFSWSFEPNLVGTHCIYVKAGKCNSCNYDPDQRVMASMPLTHTLMQKTQNGCLTSLEPVDVDLYLRQNLNYRVTLLDDTQIPNYSVPDLNITVVSSIVKRADSYDQFPKWGAFQEHFQA